jgi:hypothetical protein
VFFGLYSVVCVFWSLSEYELFCVSDVHECALAPCLNGAVCRELLGDYEIIDMLSDRQRAIVHMLSDRQGARAHSCTSETQIETIYIHFLQISNLFVEALETGKK